MSGPIGLAFRPLRDGEAAPAHHLGERVAAHRVAGREDEREHRQRAAGAGVGGERHLVLAGVGRGGEPDRAAAEGAGDPDPLGLVVGQGGGAFLEGALDGEPLRVGAERGQLLAGERVLGEDAVEAAEERRGEARHHPPAAEAPGRDARVDEQHRDAAGAGLGEHGRPELALGPDREVGLPVVEEALHPGQHVHGHVLVQAVLRQPVGEKLRRGHRAGGDEAVDLGPRLGEPAQHLEERGRLADARGVEPDELPIGPGRARLAHALGEAACVLLALGAPALEQAARDAGRPPRARQIEAEQERAGIGLGRDRVIPAARRRGNRAQGVGGLHVHLCSPNRASRSGQSGGPRPGAGADGR